MTGEETERPPRTAPYAVLGGITLCVLVLGFGLWAVGARMSGAVVVAGVLLTDGPKHAVQHLRGGMLAELEVREGAIVGTGDLLARLDSEMFQAELAYVREHLFEMSAEQDRLRAEYSGQEEIAFSTHLLAQGQGMPVLEAILDGQRHLFAAQVDVLARQAREAAQRKAQVEARIGGIGAQISSLSAQLRLAQRALGKQQDLMARGAAAVTSAMAFERDVLRLEGGLAQLRASKAEALGQVEQIEGEILRSRAERRQDALTALRDLDQSIRKFRNDARHLEAEIAASELRAPVRGVVHDLSVQAAGGVLGPAEPLLYVIPQGQPRRIQSHIAPKDIDQIALGQEVTIRLSALNQRVTPERFGKVSHISADVIGDDRTGQRSYRVEIMLEPTVPSGLESGADLVPGMPVEVFIQTGAQSPLGYLFRPIADYFARALRES